MLIGYARVSKSDGHQVLDLQIDALTNSGVKEENIYSDKISGSIDDRIGLENCLKALRENDILVGVTTVNGNYCTAGIKK